MNSVEISKELMESVENLDYQLDMFTQLVKVKASLYDNEKVARKREDEVNRVSPQDRDRIKRVKEEFERRKHINYQNIITTASNSYHLLESHIDSGYGTDRSLDIDFRITFDVLYLTILAEQAKLMEEMQDMIYGTGLEIKQPQVRVIRGTAQELMTFGNEDSIPENEEVSNPIEEMYKALPTLLENYKELVNVNSKLDAQINLEGDRYDETEMKIRYNVVSKYAEKLLNEHGKNSKYPIKNLLISAFTIVREEKIRMGEELSKNNQILFTLLLESLSFLARSE